MGYLNLPRRCNARTSGCERDYCELGEAIVFIFSIGGLMSWFHKYLPSFCKHSQRNSNAAAQQPAPPDKAPSPQDKTGSQPVPPRKRTPLSAAQLDY